MTGTPVVERETIPYQMDVFFDTFPEIDVDALEKFVNSSDPSREECEIAMVTEQGKDDLRIISYMATQGDFAVMILIHNIPSPSQDTIAHSNLSREDKTRLESHKSFALVTNTGGKDEKPCEHFILLLKVTAGLCRQGAIGAANPHCGTCYTSGQFGKLIDGKNVWDSLRTNGTPDELVLSLNTVEAGGKHYLLTRGLSLLQLPDLVCELPEGEPGDDIRTFFRSTYGDMVKTGKIPQPGEEVKIDKRKSFAFSTVPDDLDFPCKTYDLLMITRTVKKKRFFGLFG